MSKKINSCFLRVSILFCLGSISSPALAATVLSTWSPITTDFNSAANWSPVGSPTTPNYAVFSGVANPSLLPTFAGTVLTSWTSCSSESLLWRQPPGLSNRLKTKIHRKLTAFHPVLVYQKYLRSVTDLTQSLPKVVLLKSGRALTWN